MGNRCVITTAPFDESKQGIYLHWNGGQESIEGFLAAAKELGYRCPVNNDETYGLARLVGLICLYLDVTGDTSIGIGKCSDLDTDNGDNGTWLIGPGWELVGCEHGAFGKNTEPDKTATIHKQLVIGARTCATAFTESNKLVRVG